MIESAIREKTRPSLENLCHCEASSQTGRGNPRLFYAMQETLLFQGERIPVASLLGMTTLFSLRAFFSPLLQSL